MFKTKLAIICFVVLLLPGCAALPVGIGFIPGAPAYLSSLIGGGQNAYEMAVDERSTEQQMLDAIIAGHAQAELLKHKDVKADQIATHCYFGRLYLVGEYESQEQLRSIYECMDKVKNKRGVVSRLYLKNPEAEQSFFEKQANYTELRTQLMADFEVTSAPIKVEIVQGDIILLGVLADKEERDRVMAHALSMEDINRVISYLYHQENGGPEPRIMTAELAPPPEPEIPPEPPTRKRVKRQARPKVVPKPVVPVLAVTNPDRGR